MSNLKRLLQGTVAITGIDHEDWPFPNEPLDYSPVNLYLGLFPGHPAIRLDIPDAMWGGECRVEVDAYARVLEDNATIEIAGEARLYEGDSEHSPDREDLEPFSFRVRKNTISYTAPTVYPVELFNDGAGGGDHAKVIFTLTNAVVEDDEDG
jgi:hypothetical protein